MKKILCAFIAILFFTDLNAQQEAQFTQYVFNNFLFNPALSGVENYVDLKAGLRSQWRGLDGAPTTSYLSINAPIGKNFIRGSANSFPSNGDHPMSRSYLQKYTAAEPHHGIGFQTIIDKAGPLRTSKVNLTYAYHLGLTNKINMAVGIGAGISRANLDHSKINMENDSQNDPAVLSSQSTQFRPDLGLGIWIYGPRYFVGVSALKILSEELHFSDNGENVPQKLSPQVFTTAGYKMYLGNDFAAIPSTMIRYNSPSLTSVDVNLKLAFRDRFWLGGGYRVKESFSALMGMNVNYLFNISYSYDYTTSGLNTISNGSHEVVLGIMLNNYYKVICPRRIF